jgi:hypothetical protein
MSPSNQTRNLICVGVDVSLVLMSTSVGDHVVRVGRCAHAPCPRGVEGLPWHGLSVRGKHGVKSHASCGAVGMSAQDSRSEQPTASEAHGRARRRFGGRKGQPLGGGSSRSHGCG